MIKEKALLISKSKKELENIRKDLNEDFGICATIKAKLDKYLLLVNSVFEHQIATVYVKTIKHLLLVDTMLVNENGKSEFACSDKFYLCRFHVSKENKKLPETLKLVSNLQGEVFKRLGASICLEESEKAEYYNSYGIFSNMFANFKNNLKANITFQELVIKFINIEIPRVLSIVQEAIDSFEKSDDYKANVGLLDVVACLDFWGNSVDTNSEIKENRISRLSKDYIDGSAIEIGMEHPEGWNLSPKEESKFDENAEYYRSSSKYKKYFVSATPLIETQNGIATTLVWATRFFEDYQNSKNRNELFPKHFTMDDTVEVSHVLEIVSDTMLVVKSNATAQRKVEGEKLGSEPTVYDALYQNKDYRDGTFTFTVTDYYEIIGLNMLLHYTDASKFYEVYEIPLEFSFEDGLKGLKKTIYDDGAKDWICYKDISEVKYALLKNN